MLQVYTVTFHNADGTTVNGELETDAILTAGEAWTITPNAVGGFDAAPVVVAPPPPPPTQVATPVFSPAPPGPGTIPFTLSITCATPGATIYYTEDGAAPTSPPTGNTKLYDPVAKIIINTNIYNPLRLSALAVAPGLINSVVAIAPYAFPPLLPKAAAPVFSPPSGQAPLDVVVTSATPGATINYTTDGTAP